MDLSPRREKKLGSRPRSSSILRAARQTGRAVSTRSGRARMVGNNLSMHCPTKKRCAAKPGRSAWAMQRSATTYCLRRFFDHALRGYYGVLRILDVCCVMPRSATALKNTVRAPHDISHTSHMHDTVSSSIPLCGITFGQARSQLSGNRSCPSPTHCRHQKLNPPPMCGWGGLISNTAC